MTDQPPGASVVTVENPYNDEGEVAHSGLDAARDRLAAIATEESRMADKLSRAKADAEQAVEYVKAAAANKAKALADVAAAEAAVAAADPDLAAAAAERRKVATANTIAELESRLAALKGN